MSTIPYSHAVGSLMYSMIVTRSDLAYATSLVSRYKANSWQETLRGNKMDTKASKRD